MLARHTGTTRSTYVSSERKGKESVKRREYDQIADILREWHVEHPEVSHDAFTSLVTHIGEYLKSCNSGFNMNKFLGKVYAHQRQARASAESNTAG